MIRYSRKLLKQAKAHKLVLVRVELDYRFSPDPMGSNLGKMEYTTLMTTKDADDLETFSRNRSGCKSCGSSVGILDVDVCLLP